jgi:hypothetical protein
MEDHTKLKIIIKNIENSVFQLMEIEEGISDVELVKRVDNLKRSWARVHNYLQQKERQSE